MRKLLREIVRLQKIAIRVAAEPDADKKRNIAQEV
jgi:hypothetical protein